MCWRCVGDLWLVVLQHKLKFLFMLPGGAKPYWLAIHSNQANLTPEDKLKYQSV